MPIKLEHFTQKDIPKLVEWINAEPESFFFQWGGGGAAFGYPLIGDQVEKHYQDSKVENPTRILYKAVQADDPRMVGYLELNRIDYVSHHATLSRVIVDPGLQSRGIGYHMLNAVLDIGFKDFQLHRIALGVFDFNHHAISCYERVGFVREGVTREIQRVGEQYWSAIQMSVLAREWHK